MNRHKTLNINIIAAMTMIAVSCANPSQTEQKPAETPDPAAKAAEISDNNKPLFDDADGQMAKSFADNNYVYSRELASAAANGDADAQQLLATMYAYGIGGVTPDRRKAYKLYVQMAEAGNAEAQAMAGYMALYGLGPVEDADAGLELLVQAANNKSGLAFLILGNFYANNIEPSESSIAQAKLFYRQAVALGYEEAQAELDKLNQQ